MKPIEAKTDKQICSLKRGNYDTKQHWLLIDGAYITVCRQSSGKPAEASMKIPRSEFDRMARWYVTGRASAK